MSTGILPLVTKQRPTRARAIMRRIRFQNRIAHRLIERGYPESDAHSIARRFMRFQAGDSAPTHLGASHTTQGQRRSCADRVATGGGSGPERLNSDATVRGCTRCSSTIGPLQVAAVTLALAPDGDLPDGVTSSPIRPFEGTR